MKNSYSRVSPRKSEFEAIAFGPEEDFNTLLS
jgi:hypothetical protein